MSTHRTIIEHPNHTQPVGTLVRASASVVQANNYQLVMLVIGYQNPSTVRLRWELIRQSPMCRLKLGPETAPLRLRTHQGTSLHLGCNYYAWRRRLAVSVPVFQCPPTAQSSNALITLNPLPRFLTKGNLDYFSFLTKFIVMLIFYLHL